jgi:uncharacterized protein (DUF1778 family)
MSKEDKDLFKELEVQALKLSDKDIEVIMEALANPSEPNKELVKAAKEYLENLEENGTR